MYLEFQPCMYQIAEFGYDAYITSTYLTYCGYVVEVHTSSSFPSVVVGVCVCVCVCQCV